jgi:exosortase F-associated protein
MAPVNYLRPVSSFRIFLLAAALLILIVIFLFQGFNYAFLFSDLAGIDADSVQPNAVFIINKTTRLVLNDAACVVMIFAIFRDKNYMYMSLFLFLFELLVLLPVYFVIKLSLEGDSEISSPLLSQIHRLIVNPMLMLLLMTGFFYQRFKARQAA